MHNMSPYNQRRQQPSSSSTRSNQWPTTLVNNGDQFHSRNSTSKEDVQYDSQAQFNQVLDHRIPNIELVDNAFLCGHEGCSYICGTESTMKKHTHPPHKAVFSSNHLAHQVFSQRHYTFTLVREPVCSANSLGDTLKEALQPLTLIPDFTPLFEQGEGPHGLKDRPVKKLRLIVKSSTQAPAVSTQK